MKLYNQKPNKDYRRAYLQKKGDLNKANSGAKGKKKKNERERRKYLEPKKYQVFKKKEAHHVGIPFKRKMSEKLKVSTATPTSEKTPITS